MRARSLRRSGAHVADEGGPRRLTGNDVREREVHVRSPLGVFARGGVRVGEHDRVFGFGLSGRGIERDGRFVLRFGDGVGRAGLNVADFGRGVGGVDGDFGVEGTRDEGRAEQAGVGEAVYMVQDDVKAKVGRRRGSAACRPRMRGNSGTHAFLIWSTVTDAMVTCVREAGRERGRERRVELRHSAAEAASSWPSQLALALSRSADMISILQTRALRTVTIGMTAMYRCMPLVAPSKSEKGVLQLSAPRVSCQFLCQFDPCGVVVQTLARKGE